MSEYTPTTETVRERFADGFPREGYMQALEDFDRWFASEIERAARYSAEATIKYLKDKGMLQDDD